MSSPAPSASASGRELPARGRGGRSRGRPDQGMRPRRAPRVILGLLTFVAALLVSVAMWQSIWPAVMPMFVPFSIACIVGMATLAVTGEH